MTRSGLERKESRGAHFREDYPAKDAAAGGFNVVVAKGENGAMRIERRPIPPMRDDLKRIIEENK